MYKNIVDLHVHTDNSFDGNHSATFFCEKAEMMDLRAIAFTDHCEVDQYHGDDNYEKRMFQAFFEVSKVRSAFRGKLLILNGIELGQPAYDIETANSIVSKYDYDHVLGSVHNTQNVVIDGNLITSRGAGSALDFSFAIIEKLFDKQTMEKVKNSIVA